MYNEFRFAIGNIAFTVIAENTEKAVEKAKAAWKSEYDSVIVDMGEFHEIQDLEILMDSDLITEEDILLRDRLTTEDCVRLSDLYYLDHPDEWEEEARKCIESYKKGIIGNIIGV